MSFFFFRLEEKKIKFGKKIFELAVRHTAPRFPRSNRPSTMGSTVKHLARATSRILRRRSSETKGETAEMTSRAERRSGGDGEAEEEEESPPPLPAASLLSKAKVPVRGKRVREAAISGVLFLCARSVCVASSEPRRALLDCGGSCRCCRREEGEEEEEEEEEEALSCSSSSSSRSSSSS